MLPFLIFSLVVTGNGFVHADGEIPPEGVAGIVSPSESFLEEEDTPQPPETDPSRADRAPAVVDAPTDEPTGDNADLYANLDPQAPHQRVSQ